VVSQTKVDLIRRSPVQWLMPALDIYKHRWQVELFLKWINQNLRIKVDYHRHS